jgi:hypothetical protein
MNCAVSDIFDVRYGHSLELNALEQSTAKDGVAFVSRQIGHNGISAYVTPIDDLDPAPAGDISCALGGNGVLTTYIQERQFYCGRDVAILRPKVNLTKQQVLFYVYALRQIGIGSALEGKQTKHSQACASLQSIKFQIG